MVVYIDKQYFHLSRLSYQLENLLHHRHLHSPPHLLPRHPGRHRHLADLGVGQRRDAAADHRRAHRQALGLRPPAARVRRTHHRDALARAPHCRVAQRGRRRSRCGHFRGERRASGASGEVAPCCPTGRPAGGTAHSPLEAPASTLRRLPPPQKTASRGRQINL